MGCDGTVALTIEENADDVNVLDAVEDGDDGLNLTILAVWDANGNLIPELADGYVEESGEATSQDESSAPAPEQDAWTLPLVMPESLIEMARQRDIGVNEIDTAPYIDERVAVRAEVERNGVKMVIVWNAAEKQYGLHRLDPENNKEIKPAVRMAALSELLDEFKARADPGKTESPPNELEAPAVEKPEPVAAPADETATGEASETLRAFAAATNNELYDPDYKGGEWMIEATETQENIADFVAASRTYQEATAPKFGQIAGFRFVAFSKVQVHKGDPRQNLSVIDLGFARFALNTDQTNFSHEAWDGQAAATEPHQEPPAQEDPQKDADRALFQSVIDGTVQTADGEGILSPALADDLEAAYLRHAGNEEMDKLFEAAVNAYQDAMLKATNNLA
jgi:hypothetical protein